MHRVLLACLTALALAGCASAPTALEPTVFATPAQRAYQLGLEHRMVQDCRADLGPGLVTAHAQSAQILLASYPAGQREQATAAFARGYDAGPALFHKIPCEGIRALMDEQVACNYAEARRNLKLRPAPL